MTGERFSSVGRFPSGSMRRVGVGRVVLVVATTAMVACGSDGSSATDTSSSLATSTTSTTSMTTSSTAALPQDARSRLERRLAEELDPATARAVVGAMGDEQVQQVEELTAGDLESSTLLSYTPETVPADEVDSLWVFSYGFRFAAGSSAAPVDIGGVVPPMDQLVPGPTNEALARAAADFVAEHPVPIVAQWEVARVLAELGVDDVIAVEPDVAADGTVTYLSTAGVAEKGLRLAAEAGVEPGHAGVLCFADHAVRCLLTARAAGLTADVPAGVDLPAEYDTESGQLWTRSREAWVPIDLLGRLVLASTS